jgi:hypothetical protein
VRSVRFGVGDSVGSFSSSGGIPGAERLRESCTWPVYTNPVDLPKVRARRASIPCAEHSGCVVVSRVRSESVRRAYGSVICRKEPPVSVYAVRKRSERGVRFGVGCGLGSFSSSGGIQGAERFRESRVWLMCNPGVASEMRARRR